MRLPSSAYTLSSRLALSTSILAAFRSGGSLATFATTMVSPLLSKDFPGLSIFKSDWLIWNFSAISWRGLV